MCSGELLNIFGAGLVWNKVAMCHHWKLRPSACPKRASMQAVIPQAFPVLLEIILKNHHIYSVLHFHDALSDEYLAFLHNLCNTSIRYFFLESFAAKAVVYNTSLSVLWQSLDCKCLSH